MNRKIRDALEKFCKEKIGVTPGRKELVSLRQETFNTIKNELDCEN